MFFINDLKKKGLSNRKWTAPFNSKVYSDLLFNEFSFYATRCFNKIDT